MSPRRACRKDANHDTIKQILELLGLMVIDAHQFAQYEPGISDLIVHWGDKAAYVEIKTKGARLTDEERGFQRRCEANAVPYVVLRTEVEASAWARKFRREGSAL